MLSFISVPSALVLTTSALFLSSVSTAFAVTARFPGSLDVFRDATLSLSAGGEAICITGTVTVNVATSANQKLNYEDGASQLALTETIAQFLSANSSLPAQIYGGPAFVHGAFNISTKLCYPVGWSAKNLSKTVQFLIHGIGFEKSYWDFAKGYSYIDVAAAAGYPTFSYDRLGTGASDHPDPIRVVQSSIQIEIAHELIQSLRDGRIGGHRFDNVVGVGHSYGSIQSVGITVKYPMDLDAVVLTGLSINTNGFGVTFAGFNLAIANENQPLRFGDLPNGYLVTGSSISNQFGFFHYPDFDPKILALDEAAKQTLTIGEAFTLTSPIMPAPGFTGPVDVVLGEYDMSFCQGNCYTPGDQSLMVRPALYPAASNGSQAYIVPGVGHAINLHFEANSAFAHIHNFIKTNGF
ncbi:catalytic protein [Lipomyces kononenkoae]|uniref:Catalytic protein n=1 Tax=Lipomyces kononenkoae TaxID=34357 RepID=A0ACC3T3Z2_LIPKO